MGVATSGIPVTDYACPGYIGVPPGREGERPEDIYAKVLNLTGGPVPVRFLAIPGGGDKVITVANSDVTEVSAGKDLHASGAQWVHVHANKPVYIGFDVR